MIVLELLYVMKPGRLFDGNLNATFSPFIIERFILLSWLNVVKFCFFMKGAERGG